MLPEDLVRSYMALEAYQMPIPYYKPYKALKLADDAPNMLTDDHVMLWDE